MSNLSANRAKLFVVNYEEIQDRINSGDLDINDIVYTKDTHENIIISRDYEPIPVKSKILRFSTIESAENSLNASPATYAGQIVAISNEGKYVGYIVNVNNAGHYYVSALNPHEGTINYDTLGNKPIESLTGTLDNPIIVSDLVTGIYKIKGQYKIDDSQETIYLSANSNIFVVEKVGDTSNIKRITAAEMTDYVVENNTVIASTILTQEYLRQQGYVTQTYLDNRLAALDYVKQDELEGYVTNLVTRLLDETLDDRIVNVLNREFIEAEREDIELLF